MAAEVEREVPKLADYHVSEKRGFVLETPLQELPPYFQIWNELGSDLTNLILHGTLREKIHEMPLLDHTLLEGHRELRLAHLILSCLASGYVWMEGEQGIPNRIPENLAIPFWGVSERLNIPAAVGMHYSVCLANWKLKDPSGPVHLDNMDTIIKIQGGSDEAWFFLVSVQVEMDTAPAIVNIVKAQQAVKEQDISSLVESLDVMTVTMKQMKNSMKRMHERNNPDIFFNVLRMFLSGWDHAAFKKLGYDGLIYDGISEDPIKYSGGSAAQAAILYCYDEALGIKHGPTQEAKITRFKQYMPPAHSNFIKAIASGPSIKEFVKVRQDLTLTNAYDDCVNALKDFRSYHIQLACRYITIQAHKNASNNNENFTENAVTGTGGTESFLQYLKGLRNNTSTTVMQSRP